MTLMMHYEGTDKFRSVKYRDAYMNSGISSTTHAMLGRGVRFDFDEYPHLLIAGSSGSGKSVLVNSLVLSMLYRTTPAEANFVFIDPKMVEFQIYEGDPHLFCPVVTDMAGALPALENVEKEMMKRYSSMKANRQRKWTGTHIYVVIDELAQLIDFDKRRTNDLLSSIARLGRASGIHLIVATQYPTRSYISAQILTNFDCRVCLRCDSALSYRTVMGISLPEENRPLQTGDAVLYRAGKFTNFHCPYVNEKDYDFFRENIVVRKYRTGLFGFLH